MRSKLRKKKHIFPVVFCSKLRLRIYQSEELLYLHTDQMSETKYFAILYLLYAYQTLPIVMVRIFEDNEAFVSFPLGLKYPSERNYARL